MKILHLIDEPWDSGLTSYALQVADELHRSGETVVVGVRSGKKPEQLARERGLTTGTFDSALSLRRFIKSQRWDIINVHTGRTHTWSIIWRFLRETRAPIIRTRGDARPLHVNLIDRWLYFQTAGVIAVSEHVRNQYRERFRWPPPRLRTIFPAVSVDEKIIPAPPRRIGVLARLDPVKGHPVLLEAAVQVLKKFPNAKFLIAGKEANITVQVLRNQAVTLGVDHAVEFVGFVPSAEEFMRGCAIGVIPSIGSEEISRVCMEWMAVGRPVVGTRVGSLAELIEPEKTGLLVMPNDSHALAEAILRLLSDPHLGEIWGANAHIAANEKFLPKKQLQQTLEFYRWAINGRV